VKPGKYGPYVKRGDDTASVPDDLAPDELTVEVALKLLARRRATSRSASIDGCRCSRRTAATARTCSGARPTQPPPGHREAQDGEPVQDDGRSSASPSTRTPAPAALPRTLGVDPADGVAIVANNGRYGPYVQKGKDYRNIETEEQLLTITLDDAVEIFSPAQGVPSRRRGQHGGQGRRCASSAPTR
jgi:DNA topoisomerase-1